MHKTRAEAFRCPTVSGAIGCENETRERHWETPLPPPRTCARRRPLSRLVGGDGLEPDRLAHFKGGAPSRLLRRGLSETSPGHPARLVLADAGGGDRVRVVAGAGAHQSRNRAT